MAKPNLYEDNKGKVTKESGGSGGAKIYEAEADETMTNLYIYGAYKDIMDIIAHGSMAVHLEAVHVYCNYFVTLSSDDTPERTIFVTLSPAGIVNYVITPNGDDMRLTLQNPPN